MAAISVLGGLLRIIGAQEGIAWDEVILFRAVHGQSFHGLQGYIRSFEKTPPLGFWLSWLSDDLGSSRAWIRLPAVISGIALIPLTALLGRRTLGHRAGLLGAGMLAVSPFAVFYGSEARSYSMTAAFMVASTLALLWAVDRGGVWRWTTWSLVSAGALMSHYTAAAVLLAQFTWAVWTRRNLLRQIILAQLAPLIAILLWLPGLLEQMRIANGELSTVATLAPLSVRVVSRLPLHLLFGHPFVALDEVPGKVPLTIGVATTLVAFVSFIWGWAKGRERRKPTPEVALLMAVAAAPLVLMLAVSLQPGQSMLLPRNALVGLPALLLLVAALVMRLSKGWRVLAAVVLCGVFAAGSAVELRSSQRTNTQGAADAIIAHWRPGTQVIELCCAGAMRDFDGDLALFLPFRISLSSLTQIYTPKGLAAYRFAMDYHQPVIAVDRTRPGASALADKLFAGRKRVWTKRLPGVVPLVVSEYVYVAPKPGR